MHKNFLTELNHIVALHLRFDFINAPANFTSRSAIRSSTSGT